jgi:TolB-like protein
MKRCPECRRDYTDETLNYCLDDGAALVEGPGSIHEPATAVLHDTAPPPEAKTRAQLHTTDATAVFSKSSAASEEIASSRKKPVMLGIVGVVVFGGLAVAAYLLSGGWSSKQIGSIAVMPFQNESGDPNFDYVSDGMTESLINSLSELSQLSVKGRNLVFRYKGKDVDPRQIASELGVQAVLNGRVIKRGENISLSLDLVDAATGNQIWGEHYDRKVTDILTLQREIARDVSNKLKARLSGDDEKKLAKNHTVNPEAYQLYLQGRFQWNKRTGDGSRKAAEYFQAAIDRDPTYALAYVGLADSHIVGEDFPPEIANPKAKAAAQKALELDPTLGEAHAVLANVAVYYEWDFANAEREYKRAIELSPNYATAHHWYGEGLAAMGRFDESFAAYARAMELDPVSLPISSDLAWAYYYARQYDKAIAHLKKIIELDPTFVRSHFYLATVLEEKEMYAEAIEARKRGHLLQGDDVDKFSGATKRLSDAVAASGSKGFWKETLALTFEIHNKDGTAPNPVDVAQFYSKLGERDKAFEWLEKAFRNRRVGMVFLKVEPGWDNIRSDPRFADLMRRVGLPE